MDGSIVIDIAEMLSNSCCNTNLADGNTKCLHQLQSVVIGAIGGSKSWHCDAHDALAVETKLVERLNGNKQSECRIQSAADADNSLLTIDMIQALYQSHNLYVENLLARCLHILALRNEGIRIDVASEFELSLGCLLADYLVGMCATLCIDECGVGAALNMQRLDVNLAHLELWLQRETITLFKQSSVLEDDGISAIYNILSRLSKTAA